MTDPVANLLTKQGISYKVSGKDFVIKCLNPDHPDKNPSLRVNSITGATNCFACGFKTNIFKFFGLTGNLISVKQARLKEKLQELNYNFNGVDFPYQQIPFTKEFRGISAKTLKEFEAFYTNAEDQNLIDRIFFPIKDIRGKVQVFLGRHLYTAGKMRYFLYPRHAKIPIYPGYLASPNKSLVIVEGIFDMLNLYDKGLLNVTCAFGVNTLESDAALKLLPFKAQGVENIYLMFDGDDAGQAGMTKLKPILEELGYRVENIVLEEGTDPGDMTQEYVDSIRTYIDEKNSAD